MRAHPTAVIEADPRRGVFALRFTGPDGERTIPVEASTAHKGEAILTAGPDGKTMRATVSLGGDGSVPYELEVAGLGAPFDQIYAPAGGWRGESRNLFLSAVDELASKDLAGTWLDPSGKNVVIATDGAPPYRVRVDGALSTPVLSGARGAARRRPAADGAVRTDLGSRPAGTEHPRARADDLRRAGRVRLPRQRPGRQAAAARGPHECTLRCAGRLTGGAAVSNLR